MGSKRRKEIRKRLADAGLRVTSLMEHLHIDEPKRTPAQRLERLKLAAGLAHDLSPQRPRFCKQRSAAAASGPRNETPMPPKLPTG
ncbi:MAG: hypothetical protein CM1200mP2_57280 [Planctomycetaceae bacterium]|nr:MAG: hypothetical protein CM1200mP2_57280 [Planctomycetaceae bacterium]